MKNLFRCTAAVLSLAMTLALLAAAPVLAASVEEDSGDAAIAEATETGATISEAIRAPYTDTASAQSATVMIYMIGSNLESRSGLATADLQEMMAAEFGDNVHVVVQTMGCKQWTDERVSAETSQRFTVENGELILQEDALGQLDSTAPETLAGFIRYCGETYPADRNILILWDHGSGPVYGYGYDEYQESTATLTLDEMRNALSDGGVSFDFIGMDACLMSSIETCCALCPYADYLVASEDFEPCDGWSYTEWLTALGQNVAIPTPELGQIITSGFVTESNEVGEDGILAMIDLRYTEVLSATWTDFAYNNDNALTSANYSWEVLPTSRITGDDEVKAGENDEEEAPDEDQKSTGAYNMDDYYVTDILAVSNMVNAEGAAALSSALSNAIVACNATQGDANMTGLSVTLPYGNSAFYQKAVEVFLNCGFSETYLEWLGTFADCLESGNYYDNWDAWTAEWSSWEEFQAQNTETADVWEAWVDDNQDSLEGIISWNPEVSEYGDWYTDEASGLYYCVYANGDITYQDPATHLCYYYMRANDSWWAWHMRSWNWVMCDDPGFSTALTNPVSE